MNLPGRRCCSLLVLGPVLAWAQPGGPAPASYVDRVIEGITPLPADDDGTADFDRSGWPRFLRLETRLGTPAVDTQRHTVVSGAVSGFIETPNHGALSVDGSYTPRDRSSTLTLRQRDLPLPGGWFGQHEAGVISAPAPGLARLPSRVLLPAANLRGLRGEWQHDASGVQLLAAGGEPGQLGSEPSNGFQGLGGRRTVFGAQWQVGGAVEANAGGGLASVFAAPSRARSARSGWTLAFQREDARDIPHTPTEANPSGHTDASGSHLALRQETDGRRTQAQVVRSEITASGQRAQGYWLDSEWDDGPRKHGLSAYRLEPGLSWAAQAMPADIQGVTARTQWRTRQWSADVSYDWLRSVSGRTASGSFTSGAGRWRLDRDNQLGGGAAIRHFDGKAWNAWADWRRLNGWGPSGLRLELGGGADLNGPVQQFTYDQEWAAPLGWTLTTSLGRGRYARDPDSGRADRLWSAALAVQAPLGNDASLRGQFGTEQRSNGQQRHNLNLGTTWRLGRQWSLEGQYTRFVGRSPLTRPLDPLAPVPVETVALSSDRSFKLVLRYEIEAGTRSVPLGGKVQDGGGRIEGVVFFDTNRSGTQEASETGVPGVLVALDNRYAVRTDTQGRFVFPFVAAGPRTVSVRNETLPLPWSVVDEGQARIDVHLRETTTLSLPVQEPR